MCEEGFVETATISTADDIRELPPVKRVRMLEIVSSDLETLEGLECIEWVETLRIEDNPELRELSGLEGLVEVTPEPCDEPWATAECVTHMPSPSPYSPLQLPPGVGDAIIAGNPRLETTAGLDALEIVFATLEIRDNPSLISLAGLDALAYVASGGLAEAALRIEGNTDLESLDALVAYEGGARLEVRNNPQLLRLFPPRASGLDWGPDPSWKGGLGHLVLDDLPRIEALDGLSDWGIRALEFRNLPLIEEIPSLFVTTNPSELYMDRVVLDGNVALHSLAGLPPIIRITGQLIIRDNDALADLSGLEQLEAIFGETREDDEIDDVVLIEGNSQLRNLGALDPSLDGSFERAGSRGAILNNANLPTCLIERLFDEVKNRSGVDLSSWTVEGNGDEPCL